MGKSADLSKMAEVPVVGDENVDELLAGLASMGFEFKESQQAVQAGKNTLESAVEWLIKRKTSPNSTKSEQVPLYQPAAVPEVQPSHLGPHQSESEPKYLSGSEAENVSSHFAPSNEQRKDKERYEQKERETIRMDAKRRKIMDKKARQQVLQHIAEDRQFVKSKATLKTAAVSSTNPSAPTSSSPQHNQCVLQMRFPSGLVKKERFHADSKFESVIAFACQDYPIKPTEIQLIQPFPHREFTNPDATLRELGLVPGGSIVVQRRKLYPLCGSGNHTDSSDECPTPGEANESTGDISSDNPVNRADGVEREEEGIQADGVEREEEDIQAEEGRARAEYNPEGQAIDVGNIRVFPGGPFLDPGRIPHLAANPVYEQLLGRQVGHVWGQGMMLGEVEHNPHAVAPVPQATSAGDSAMKRLERKLQQHGESGPSVDGVHILHRDVEKLVGLLVNHVCQRLSGRGLPIVSLGGLPHAVCDKILAQLIKNKSLTSKTLNPFLPCCLKYVKLDCYLLVTNELLTALRLHKHLTHLSLRSCPIITDKALEAVAILKRLKSLNLSQCSQLTDKSFVYIKDLSSLTVLQMDGTKVTDKGVCLFLENSSCCGNLVNLSLGETSITDRSLEAMKVLKSLRILGLENTKVTSLEVVKHLPTLGSLNISHTKITDSSLAALHNHAELTSLSLLSTCVTDEGLLHLQGLQLSAIKLPNRHSITDKGVTYIQGLPLVSLDLTDYINVTDEGIKHLQSLSRSLQKLSLCNTKLTDIGMMSIRGLVNVEELNLDRTAITDAGCSILSNLERLQILSMSATGITNKLLIQKSLQPCKSLIRLNLSRTRVSNRGITHLTLPSLSSLNLDWTRVTSDCQVLLTGCPSLKSLRTNSCSPPDMESPDESEEDS